MNAIFIFRVWTNILNYKYNNNYLFFFKLFHYIKGILWDIIIIILNLFLFLLIERKIYLLIKGRLFIF